MHLNEAPRWRGQAYIRQVGAGKARELMSRIIIVHAHMPLYPAHHRQQLAREVGAHVGPQPCDLRVCCPPCICRCLQTREILSHSPSQHEDAEKKFAPFEVIQLENCHTKAHSHAIGASSALRAPAALQIRQDLQQ